MPKHDHHKATHQDDAAKTDKDTTKAHEEGETQQSTPHSQIANERSSKAQEESNEAHVKAKGPKKL